MAQKDYKIGEEIKVTYQAPGALTGQIVIMEIYDETGAKDIVNFPDVTMTEVGAKGCYRDSFTPDEGGNWEIIVALDNGEGQAVKQYSVAGYNVDAIGLIVSETEATLDIVKSKVDDLDSPAMLG